MYVRTTIKSKWHTRTPTHGLASTLRMRTAISPGQWQPWTAVSASLGLISMAYSSRRAATGQFLFTTETGARHPLSAPAPNNTFGSWWLGTARQFSTVWAGKVETPWELGWVASSVASRFYSRLTSPSMYFWFLWYTKTIIYWQHNLTVSIF